MKINFDAWLTIEPDDNEHWWANWYFHFLPRVTLFSNHIVKTYKDHKGEDCLCNVGKEYDLQIGWLCFEVSISVERRTNASKD